MTWIYYAAFTVKSMLSLMKFVQKFTIFFFTTLYSSSNQMRSLNLTVCVCFVYCFFNSSLPMYKVFEICDVWFESVYMFEMRLVVGIILDGYCHLIWANSLCLSIPLLYSHMCNEMNTMHIYSHRSDYIFSLCLLVSERRNE